MRLPTLPWPRLLQRNPAPAPPDAHHAARLLLQRRVRIDPALHRRQSALDADFVSQTQTALALFLGCNDTDALALACSALEKRRAVQHGAGEPPPADAVHQLLAAASGAGGPSLLALPFNAVGVQWLRAVARQGVLPVCVLDRPALRACLAPPQAGAEAVRWSNSAQLIQQVKAGAGRNAAPSLIVTMPELHPPGAGTTAQVDFLGQRLRLSLLEPLLCAQGVRPMATLAVQAAAGNAPALLPIWHGSRPGPGTAAAALAWLAGHLQDAARAMPGQTLSWPQLYRASAPFQAIARSNRLKQVEAFFAAWQAAGGGLQDQTRALIAERLTALRAAA